MTSASPQVIEAGSADVFISYSTEDRAVASQTLAALEDRGHKCWEYERNNWSDSTWMEGVKRALSRTRLLILLLSKSASESAHVDVELRLARELGVRVLPVRIEDCVIPESLIPLIGSAPRFDLFPSRNSEAYDRLSGVAGLWKKHHRRDGLLRWSPLAALLIGAVAMMGLDLAPPMFPGSALVAAACAGATIYLSDPRQTNRQGIQMRVIGQLVLAGLLLIAYFASSPLLTATEPRSGGGERFQVGFGLQEWSLSEEGLSALNSPEVNAHTPTDLIFSCAGFDEATIAFLWRPWTIWLSVSFQFAILVSSFVLIARAGSQAWLLISEPSR